MHLFAMFGWWHCPYCGNCLGNFCSSMMLGCVTPGSLHLKIILDCESRVWLQQWPHPCSSHLWCLQQGWVVLISSSVAAAVTVCAFLSDLYWYTDHSCEEYKAPSVPAPHLPGIPCSGTVQPQHRWQRHHAGTAVGRGALQGCVSPSEPLPPPVCHESPVGQGLQWLLLIIPGCGELQWERQQPGCFFYFSALEHVKKTYQPKPNNTKKNPKPNNQANCNAFLPP